MSDVKKDVKKLMKRVREGRLPTSEFIVNETFKELGFTDTNCDSTYIRENFNHILHEVWQQTLEVLERYERDAYAEGIPDELIKMKESEFNEAEIVAQKKGFTHSFQDLFSKLYPYLLNCFLSISQSRKTRGGRDFELQFGKLLDLMDVPYQKFRRASRVDFMIPSDEAFKNNPTSAAIASAKRTLRERWREVVEELYDMRSPNIFLVTADFDISKGHIRDICGRYRIQLVVWDELKEAKFNDEPLVLGYTQWVNERLPVLEKFWK